MSSDSDYGAGGDLDVYDIEVSADGEVALVVPIAHATLPESSQGEEYLPPAIDSDPSRISSDTPLETEGPRVMEQPEKNRAVLDRMRARCQSVQGDTRRSRRHDDGKALAKRIVRGLTTFRRGWCVLTTLIPTKTDGYVQLSYDGANHFATLGEVLCWAKGEAKPAHDGNPNGPDPIDVSHRCHEPKCTVESHVCLETKALNNSRKGCRVRVPCVPTCTACGGSRDIFICTHTPACIAHVPGYASLDDYYMRGICTDRHPVGVKLG